MVIVGIDVQAKYQVLLFGMLLAEIKQYVFVKRSIAKCLAIFVGSDVGSFRC